MGLALLLQILFYHPPSFQQLHGGKRTVMQEVKRIDFVGIFLMVAGLSMFLLGISWGSYASVSFQLSSDPDLYRRLSPSLDFG